MNTFSAFRFAAQTLHPRPAHFHCLNPLGLRPCLHVRFKSKKAAARLRNEAIPFAEVSFVDEDNVLVKMSLRRLLNSIDHTKEWVELVATTPNPVVKIINKKAAIVKEKQVKEKRRETVRRNMVKEVQLTWGSEQSDLEHKLARVRSYLEIGAKVDIVFTTKPNAARPAAHVMNQKLKDTVDMMADISTEWKPVEWRRNMAAIFLRGTVDPSCQLTPEQIQIVDEEAAATEDEETATEKDQSLVEEKGATAEALAPPPPPPLRIDSTPAEPSKPKSFIDLTTFGYQPPARRNPLSGMRDKKKYGKRSNQFASITQMK